jgi:hypothetical protein
MRFGRRSILWKDLIWTSWIDSITLAFKERRLLLPSNVLLNLAEDRCLIVLTQQDGSEELVDHHVADYVQSKEEAD